MHLRGEADILPGMEFLGFLRSLAVTFGPFLLLFALFVAAGRHKNRKIQRQLEPLAERFGLRPLVQRPGIMDLGLGNPGLVGRLAGQEVWLTVGSQGGGNRSHEDDWVVSLRMRVSPGLSREFSATREGRADRLLRRLRPEETVGDEDLDNLLHIRSLGAGDREVLRLQPIQNGLFRLVGLGTFEFTGGELRLSATSTKDHWFGFAQEVLTNARTFAHALVHHSVDATANSVWSA